MGFGFRGWAFVLSRQPGHRLEAEGALREAIRCFEQAVAKDPLSHVDRHYAADTHRYLGYSLGHRGLVGEALAEYVTAIRIHEELVDRLPDPKYGRAERFDAFLECRRRVLAQAGQIDRTGRSAGRPSHAAGDGRRLQQPRLAPGHGGHPGPPRLRPGRGAGARPSRSIRCRRRTGIRSGWRAIAQGDWQGAIEALTKSEAMAPGRDLAFNAFFLAMAHWQLGERPRLAVVRRGRAVDGEEQARQ